MYYYNHLGPDDIVINTPDVTQFFANPMAPRAAFTFVIDGIEEEDETFALDLEDITAGRLLMGRGVFFRKILQCTIIDSDGKVTKLSLLGQYGYIFPALPFQR